MLVLFVDTVLNPFPLKHVRVQNKILKLCRYIGIHVIFLNIHGVNTLICFLQWWVWIWFLKMLIYKICHFLSAMKYFSIHFWIPRLLFMLDQVQKLNKCRNIIFLEKTKALVFDISIMYFNNKTETNHRAQENLNVHVTTYNFLGGLVFPSWFYGFEWSQLFELWQQPQPAGIKGLGIA